MNQNQKKINHLYINVKLKQNNQLDAFKNYFQFLKKELEELQSQYQFALQTIYLNLTNYQKLTISDWNQLLSLIDEVNQAPTCQYSIEIPLTCNFKQSNFMIWKKFAINRIVWKIRSFSSQRTLNSYQKIIQASKNDGFTNFSLDYQLSLKHFSLPFDKIQIQLWNLIKPPHFSFNYDPKLINFENSHFGKWLSKNNYHHYEFFSYSQKPAFDSAHTLAYLNLNNWIGIGPEATSFVKSREIIRVVQNNQAIPWAITNKELSMTEYYQWILLQGLTLKNGIKLSGINQKAFNCFEQQLDLLIKTNQLIVNDSYLKINATNSQVWWNVLKKINQLVIN